MVSYQTLTAIAFEVAREKGASFSGQRPANATAVVELVAACWNENKQQYKQMTEAQARRQMQKQIEIR